MKIISVRRILLCRSLIVFIMEKEKVWRLEMCCYFFFYWCFWKSNPRETKEMPKVPPTHPVSPSSSLYREGKNIDEFEVRYVNIITEKARSEKIEVERITT